MDYNSIIYLQGKTSLGLGVYIAMYAVTLKSINFAV